MAGDQAEEYFVDPATGEISLGRDKPWLHRMGPYPSRQAAAHAFDKARQRNEEWDEQDRSWRGEND